MLEAKEVLFIVLAFCALWLTAFLCWLLYQFASILKNVNDTVEDVRGTMGKMEAALTGIRGKFDALASAAMLAITGGKKIAEYFSEKKEKKRKP